MNLVRAGIVVAGFMLIGRISGFLREISIAQIGGASQQSDMMIVLLTFPDMMISLLLGGGLTAALVPSFRSLPRGAGFALFLRASLLIVAFFGLLALLIGLFPVTTLRIVAPGWAQGLVEQTKWLFRLTLIALPVTAISGVVIAFLDSKERFTFGAIGTLIFNCSLISALLIFAHTSPGTAVVIGILFGAALRLAVQLMASRRFWEAPDFTASYDGLGLLRRFAGSFGFFSVLAFLPPTARAYASLVEPGALSMFNYAYKLMELPMAIVVGAIVTVLLPRLSGHVSNGDLEKANSNIGLAIRAVGILLMGISVVSIFQAETIVRTAFFGAAFTSEQIHDLGTVLSLVFVGLPFQGLVLLYGTAFVSHDRTGPLILVSVVMVLVMASAGFYFKSIWGLEGLMLAYVLSQVSGAFLLTTFLLYITGPMPFITALKQPLRTILLPLAVCLAFSWFFHEIEFTALPALLLSAGAFFAAYIWADPSIIRLIMKRQN